MIFKTLMKEKKRKGKKERKKKEIIDVHRLVCALSP